MSYRLAIFHVGQKYRVRSTFESGPTSVFTAGEVLIFERDFYSPYDNSFVYSFHSIETGETKEWWLSDGQNPDVWHSLLEEVG